MKAFLVFCITEDTKPYTRQVKAMDSKTTIQHNKVMHLEDSMVMYGIYNAETSENFINTVHHAFTISHQTNEKLFTGQQGTDTASTHVC